MRCPVSAPDPREESVLGWLTLLAEITDRTTPQPDNEEQPDA